MHIHIYMLCMCVPAPNRNRSVACPMALRFNAFDCLEEALALHCDLFSVMDGFKYPPCAGLG